MQAHYIKILIIRHTKFAKELKYTRKRANQTSFLIKKTYHEENIFDFAIVNIIKDQGAIRRELGGAGIQGIRYFREWKSSLVILE